MRTETTMKKLYFLIYFTIFTWQFSIAQDFVVQNFTADIFISPEGYFDVVEKYDIDFTEAKHGIFREIITKFDFEAEHVKVSKHEIYISDIDVPGEKFKINGIFEKQIGNNINIRIGDKNTLVSGNKHYEIRYRVKNALIFTDDLVQLYWNIKPADWHTFFDSVSFTIHAPEGASLSSENCFVYSGETGNTEPSTEFDYEYSGNIFSGKSKQGFRSSYGQNVTVLVKLPKALVKEMDFTPSIWKRYGWLGILGLAFIAMIMFIRNRLQANKVIVVTSYYPPEKMDPAMVGYLIDNIANRRDISCLLPYWATKGIIRMEEIPKGENDLNGDLKFIKLKDLPEDTPSYESKFFHQTFSKKNEVLASSFDGNFMEALRLLNKESDRYYRQSKAELNKWKVIGWAVSWFWAFFSILLFTVLTIIFQSMISFLLIPLLLLNFVFFFLIFPVGFAYLANRTRVKNQQGKSIMPELLGFYQFIKIAEIDRIKALLIQDPYYFEKTMPYAVAFNLLKQWTAKFDGLIVQAPDWYKGSTGSTIRFNTFASSFMSGMALTKTSMVRSSSSSSSSRSSSSFRSSGGGSSGGGAGRGGGGSW